MPNEVKTVRGSDVRELEAVLRDHLIGAMARTTGPTVVAPTMLDQGHPSFIVADSGGMFLVTVKRLSKATLEQGMEAAQNRDAAQHVVDTGYGA